MAPLPFADQPLRRAIQVAPGAVWLRQWLPIEEQRAVAARCHSLMEAPAGGYTPIVRGGGRMRVRMMCLGHHWNPLTYSYMPTRADYDHAPVAPVPAEWALLAARVAKDAGYTFDPDICLINFYDAGGRMGVHQDKDESRESLDAGHPVVSISVGDTARFLFGGLTRKEPLEPYLLASGDVFVFGGPARLRFHGVSRILPATAPPQLGLAGRFNLTFRRR